MIKDLPLEERPRERFLNYGKEALSDSEILAIILKTGTKNKSAKDLACDILKDNSISDLATLNKENLMKIPGIKEAKALEVLASIELGRRIFIKKKLKKKDVLNNAKIIYEKNKDLFRGKKQEYFYCLYLNTKKELIERKLLFMGTINKSIIHPREIFKEAYLLSASSIVCMHNHPSGDKTPSKEDIFLTENLMNIGKLQGIPVVDHIIFTDSDYYSFYEEMEDFLK